MHDKVDLILGCIFILFYAGQRFNTPSTNRSSTTAGRYFLALFLYCLVTVGFYFTLVNFPHLLGFLMQGNQDAIPEWSKELSSPLFVALSLTILLPKVPFLSSTDRWICTQLQNMAAIPYEIRRLSAELRRGKWEVSNEDQDTLRQILLDEGFAAKHIQFDAAYSPVNAWTRLSALLHKIEEWESDRRMAGYFAAFNADFQKLRHQHEWLTPRAKTCFRLLDESASAHASGTHEAVQRYQETFSDQVNLLHQGSLDFIARGVLHAELTDSSRLNRLQALGFSVSWERSVFTLNQMLLLFGVVCVVILSGTVFFSNATRGVTYGVVMVRTIMISVIYSVAVACAVLPKSRWKFAQKELRDVRPISFYLVAAVMAVVINQAVSFTFNAILMRDLACGWHRFLLSYPWLLITFGTSLTTAILVDNQRYSFLSRWQQRSLEGTVQAVVMLGVGLIAHRWLLQRYEIMSQVQTNYCVLKYQVSSLTMVMGTSGLVGFVLGFVIPTWYREAPRRGLDLRAEAPSPMISLSGSRPIHTISPV